MKDSIYHGVLFFWENKVKACFPHFLPNALGWRGAAAPPSEVTPWHRRRHGIVELVRLRLQQHGLQLH